jgi:hypothetical protein
MVEVYMRWMRGFAYLKCYVMREGTWNEGRMAPREAIQQLYDEGNLNLNAQIKHNTIKEQTPRGKTKVIYDTVNRTKRSTSANR